MASAELEVVISGVDKTRGTFRGVTKNLQTLGKAALATGATALAAVGTGAVVAGAKAVQLGADANETASLLENSLGPAADNLNNSLRTMAEDTNRSFFELQQGSATFVAMTRSMGANQEQAADLGASFVGMANDLGSFFNVPTEQALQDLQGGLAGSSETLQKYGIDIRETTLKQMALDQGLIESASDTLPRLTRAQLIQQAVMEQATDAMGDAERTSGSWQNMLRGLKGRLADTTTEIGQKLIPVLTPMLEKFLDFVDNVLPPLLEKFELVVGIFDRFFSRMRGGQGLVENLGSLFAQLGITFGMTGPQARELKDQFVGLVNWGRELLSAIGGFLTPVIGAVTQFVSWKDVLIALGIAVASVVIPAIASIVAAIAPVIAVFVAVIATVALLRNAWESNWLGIRDIVQAAIKKVQQIITTVVTAIRAFWDKNGDQILAKAQEIWTNIQTAIQVAITTVQGIIERVTAIIQQVWGSRSDEISGKAQRVWSLIQGFISDAINTIQSVIETVVGAVTAFWQSNHEQIESVTTAIWDAVSQYIEGVIENIGFILDGFIALFTGDWEGFGEAIGRIWRNTWDTVTGILGTLWDGFKPMLDSLWSSISSWFSGIDWASLGQRIVDGIVAGLTSAAGALYSAVQGIISGALGAGQSAAEEGSPARAFIPLGENITRGIAAGIAGAAGATDRAMQSTVNNLTTNNITLNINTSASSERVIDDARMARAFLGGV